MKKLMLILILSLSSIGFGQIEIEIFDPQDGYRHLTNDTAKVCLELSEDSTSLLIQDSANKAYFDVGSVNVIVADTSGSSFTITEIIIINDLRGLYRITLWGGMNLVLFEYESELTVLNSGEGITYDH